MAGRRPKAIAMIAANCAEAVGPAISELRRAAPWLGEASPSRQAYRLMRTGPHLVPPWLPSGSTSANSRRVWKISSIGALPVSQNGMSHGPSALRCMRTRHDVRVTSARTWYFSSAVISGLTERCRHPGLGSIQPPGSFLLDWV